MEKKTMKNIKKPTYAVELGKGLFAAAPCIYVCNKCGLRIRGDSNRKPQGFCSAGGAHFWSTTWL